MTTLGSSASASTIGTGALRVRLIIESASYLPDGSGGAGREWVRVGEAWAEVHGMAGQQHARQDAQGQRVTYRIRMRWRSGLTTEARFRSGKRVLRLASVYDPDGRRRVLECIATEDLP